jgi:hypothetical protein
MDSSFRKLFAINQVGSVDSIFKSFRPKVGMSEGSGEAISKTIKSLSQMLVYGETDDIVIDSTDSKNIHISVFNRSYFELHLDFTIDVFQGLFLPLAIYARQDWIGAAEDWTDWTTKPALVNIAKITYFFIGFKNSTDCIKY